MFQTARHTSSLLCRHITGSSSLHASTTSTIPPQAAEQPPSQWATSVPGTGTGHFNLHPLLPPPSTEHFSVDRDVTRSPHDTISMLYGQGRRQVKKCGVDTHGERAECETIMGSGAELQRGPGFRAERLIRGLGAKPPEAENLLAFGAHRKQQICCILCILQTPQTPGN